jgi:hypothetical protein
MFVVVFQTLCKSFVRRMWLISDDDIFSYDFQLSEIYIYFSDKNIYSATQLRGTGVTTHRRGLSWTLIR